MLKLQRLAFTARFLTIMAVGASLGCQSAPGSSGGQGGAAASSSAGTGGPVGAGGAAGTGGGSGGCAPLPTPAGADACTTPLTPGTDRKCTFTFKGQTREVLLYAPQSLGACAAAPLVVDAHGSSETDREQAGLDPFLNWPGGLGSGFRLVADREGILVAEPQGIGNQWDPTDADLMVHLVALVSGVARVDPARVFMTGISNGGGLTYWTGCKDSKVFKAFGPVSGYGDATCPRTSPAPLIHFHSPDDKLVSYADGQAAFQTWVKANHCMHKSPDLVKFGGPSSDPRPVCLKSGPSDAPPWTLAACEASAPESSCETWDQCDGGVHATFCTVAPDHQYNYDQTGGHVLYINGTGLSLAAVAWEAWRAL